MFVLLPEVFLIADLKSVCRWLFFAFGKCRREFINAVGDNSDNDLAARRKADLI
jgi:hypothetical protein